MLFFGALFFQWPKQTRIFMLMLYFSTPMWDIWTLCSHLLLCTCMYSTFLLPFSLYCVTICYSMHRFLPFSVSSLDLNTSCHSSFFILSHFISMLHSSRLWFSYSPSRPTKAYGDLFGFCLYHLSLAQGQTTGSTPFLITYSCFHLKSHYLMTLTLTKEGSERSVRTYL